MKKIDLNSGWRMHRAGSDEYIPAVVPGSVYTDLLKEGKMPDPFWKDNEGEALALMDHDYEYVLSFDASKELLSEEACVLHFDGLDTLCDIFFNGKLLGRTANMHRVWEFDIKGQIQESNELKVYFHSPTEYIKRAYQKAPTKGSEDAMQGFVHLRKAHCMFGWDWGAHLPDAGIFRPVSILAFSKARLESVSVQQRHESGKVTLLLKPEVSCIGSCGEPLSYRAIVTSPDGESSIYEDSPKEILLENPKLWWPNGYGEQPLYNIRVELCDAGGETIDVWERKVGLRTLTVSTDSDEWGNEFCFVINNIKIFAMGADYIPEDHLLGRVNREVTKGLLKKAVFANHNCIRVWGGGYYPDDYFFDICDELGILVWQDFMFACGVYDLTPEFEANIRAEIKDNLIRLRHHASLGLLCGNNEMEMFVKQGVWVSKPSERRDYTIMYERIIPSLVKEYAPDIFYWPASPSSGGCFDEPNDENRGDVHYWEVWHGNKPFSEYRKFYFRFLSEFGFQSFPSEKTIETFTDEAEDKNVFSYIMERHQRNGAANGKIMNYMQQTYLYPTDFSTLIYASQMLQADAIRYGIEHFRRNRGRCMGTVVWQLNDCWPVASWSSIDYCGRLKALHYAEKRAFAPVMASAMEEGEMTCEVPLNWLPREIKQEAVFNVANETKSAVDAVLKWQLRNADGTIVRESTCSEIGRVPALSSTWSKKTDFSDADRFNQYVSFSCEVGGAVVSSGTFIFTVPKYFKYKDPHLKATVHDGRITVTADAYARGVEILNENEDLILSDNYFDMNAGEVTVDIISGDASKLRLRSVYDVR